MIKRRQWFLYIYHRRYNVVHHCPGYTLNTIFYHSLLFSWNRNPNWSTSDNQWCLGLNFDLLVTSSEVPRCRWKLQEPLKLPCCNIWTDSLSLCEIVDQRQQIDVNSQELRQLWVWNWSPFQPLGTGIGDRRDLVVSGLVSDMVDV